MIGLKYLQLVANEGKTRLFCLFALLNDFSGNALRCPPTGTLSIYLRKMCNK